LDVQNIARDTINKIGYTKGEYQFSGDSCGVISLIHEQSQDINQGVDRATKEEQGAGDQGMMFGYATKETENFMPLALDISHKILQVLADLRREGKEIDYLRPDAKAQVTIEYSDENVPQRIDTIVVSTQHDDFDEDDVTVFGVDYELPFIQKPLFTLSHYAEAAQIKDHGMGFIFPGFYSKFLIFHMNLEYRMYQDDFLPAFFDQLYDEQRAFVQTYADSTTVLSKESLVNGMTKSYGWYGALTTNILNFLFVTVAYEDMYDANDENFRSLWGKANFDTKLIPKLTKAEIGYSQTGFDKLDALKTSNAMIDGTLGYSLGGNTQLVGSYQERYVDLNNDGKIKGSDETITSMSMGVEFSF